MRSLGGLRGRGGQALGTLLDAQQHLALHDEAAGLHDDGVGQPGGRRRAGRLDAVAGDQPSAFSSPNG